MTTEIGLKTEIDLSSVNEIGSGNWSAPVVLNVEIRRPQSGHQESVKSENREIGKSDREIGESGNRFLKQITYE